MAAMPPELQDYGSCSAAAFDAILGVIGTPSAEMVEAGADAAGDICSHWPGQARPVFQAMIRKLGEGV